MMLDNPTNRISDDAAVTGCDEFGTKSVASLFWKYTLFAMMGLAMQGLEIVADGYIVGRGIGPEGLATIGIIVPLNTITIALFLLFGVGASTLGIICIGQGRLDISREIYATVVVTGFFVSMIISVVVLANLDQVLRFLGATDEILPYAKKYALPYMLGFPIMILGNISYFFVRAAGKPLYAMLAYSGGAAIAIFFEYAAIFYFGMGIAGSAYAFIIGNGCSIFLLFYLQLGTTPFRIHSADLKMNRQIFIKRISQLIKICESGTAIFVIQISTIFSTILINRLMIQHGGTAFHVAAFGIINAYIAYIINILTTAFITGIQPIASYNIAAKRYSRVRKLIIIGMTQGTATLILIVAAVHLFSRPIVSFFVGSNDALVSLTMDTMKVFLLLCAFGNATQIASGYFMSIGNNKMAIFNGVIRLFIAVPLYFLLSHFFGLNGLWASQPFADAFSFGFIAICIWREVARIKALEESSQLNIQYF